DLAIDVTERLCGPSRADRVVEGAPLGSSLQIFFLRRRKCEHEINYAAQMRAIALCSGAIRVHEENRVTEAAALADDDLDPRAQSVFVADIACLHCPFEATGIGKCARG